MADTIGNLAIGIFADDKTEKGAKAAEKRLSQVGKRVGDHNKAIAKETERSLARSGKSVLGMMSRVEKGVASALGSKSMTSGLASRLGAVGEAGSAMAGGLGEAAAAGGILSGAATGVAVAVGGTIAVLGAAAYAAFKFSDSWAKGAASLSRTAETIGVSTKALTEFNAAAERVGVDKGTATGAMGSLSQTLNDARYGRNTGALEVMRRLGVSMKTNADGTVNTEAMLPDIANALQRQNSSGRRTAAGALGIPLAALPAFTQGGKSLSADMKSADTTAVVIDDRVGNMARGVARKGVLAGQAFDRTVDYAGRSAAGLMGGKADDAIAGGMRDFDSAVHGDFAPGAKDIKNAATTFGGAVSKFVGGGVSGTTNAMDLSARIEHLGEHSRQDQVSPKGATGVMQLMPGTARVTAQRLGEDFDPGRYKHDEGYSRHLGRSYLAWLMHRYDGDETLATAGYNAGEGNVDKWIKRFGDPRKGQISDHDFANHIPFKETRDYVHRVVVEFKNAPPGTRATVHSQHGGISHALAG